MGTADFKAVILANWGEGHYPAVTEGTTTIDDICTAANTVFNAFADSEGNALMPSGTKLMPFFGLREFTAVAWKENQATVLTDAVTLLRAVAKVEVVVVNDSGDACARVKVVTNFDDWTIDESSIPLAYIRI